MSADSHDAVRRRLLDDLSSHCPGDRGRIQDRDRIAALVSGHAECFHRTHFDPGHVTGSALLLSRDGGRVLLNRHATLDKWLGFGGHADGEADILNVARRETVEESGIAQIEPVFAGIFDVDIHPIPENARRGEPAHLHFDIRYLFRVAGSEDFKVSAESSSLRWCAFDEALALDLSAGMRRLIEKAAAL